MPVALVFGCLLLSTLASSQLINPSPPGEEDHEYEREGNIPGTETPRNHKSCDGLRCKEYQGGGKPVCASWMDEVYMFRHVCDMMWFSCMTEREYVPVSFDLCEEVSPKPTTTDQPTHSPSTASTSSEPPPTTTTTTTTASPATDVTGFSPTTDDPCNPNVPEPPSSVSFPPYPTLPSILWPCVTPSSTSPPLFPTLPSIPWLTVPNASSTFPTLPSTVTVSWSTSPQPPPTTPSPPPTPPTPQTPSTQQTLAPQTPPETPVPFALPATLFPVTYPGFPYPYQQFTNPHPPNLPSLSFTTPAPTLYTTLLRNVPIEYEAID